MAKKVQIDTHLDSYHSFFDHHWFEEKTEETRDTVLYQPVFDLGLAWRYTANTHILPWLLATTVQDAVKMNLNTTEPFGKKYVSALRDKLVERMGNAIRPMLQKRMHVELERIYQDVCTIAQTPQDFAPDTMWNNMLENSEFQFAIVGSQRLCYGAIYYTYEDFLTRCVGLAKRQAHYRMPRGSGFPKEIRAEFGPSVCSRCWDDADINLARVTRHALVHNGCRVTRQFRNASKTAARPLAVLGDEIQIVASDTSHLFELLKSRASQLIEAALQHPNV